MSTPSDSTANFATSTGPRGSKALIGDLKSWPNPAFNLQSSPLRPKRPHPLLTVERFVQPSSCSNPLPIPEQSYWALAYLKKVTLLPSAPFSYQMPAAIPDDTVSLLHDLWFQPTKHCSALVAPVLSRHPLLCFLDTVLCCTISSLMYTSFPMGSNNCCLVPSSQSPESSNPKFAPLTEKHSPLSNISSRCCLNLGPTTYWNYLLNYLNVVKC